MSTVIRFECRNPLHGGSRSTGRVGGIVMHHGTFGYCDAYPSATDHRWTPTGGVFLEDLIKEERDDRSDEPRHISHARGHAGPLHLAR